MSSKIKSNILIVISLIVVGLVLAILSDKEPSGLPARAQQPVRSGHPRVILTNDLLTAIRAKAIANHADWIALRQWCDNNLGARQAAWYNGNPWPDYFAKYALAYLVLKESDPANAQKYGAEAFIYLKALARDCAQIGDGGTGPDMFTLNLCQDESWSMRSRGMYLALGYDWLYDYAEFTPAIKQEFYNTLNAWITSYGQMGYRHQGPPDNNYWGAYFATIGLTAYATYGDNPQAQQHIDNARNMFNNMLKSEAETGILRGGISPEGPMYGNGHFYRMLFYVLAVKTATGEDLIANGFNWPKEIVRGLIYVLKPPMDKQYTGGDANYPGSTFPNLALILSHMLRGTPEGGYAKYYFNHIGTTVYASSPLEKLLFDSPAVSEQNYKITEPLSYYAAGVSLLASRSSWATDAVWAIFQGQKEVHISDHNHADNGHFDIQRGADYLVVESTVYGDAQTPWHNSILIDERGECLHYPPGQTLGPAGSGVNQTEAIKQESNFVYMKSNIYSAYNPHNTWLGESNPLTHFHRQFVYLRPNIFLVFDRIGTVKADYVKKWSIHFGAPETVSGNTISAVVGNSKVFSKTLLPENFNINHLAEARGYGRVEITPAQASLDDIFLHVLYATASSVQQMPSSQKIDATNMTGAYIQAPTDYHLVMFSKTESSQTAVTYTLPSTSQTIKHLITDLAPATYNVYRDGVLITTQAVDSNGALYFSFQGGSTFQISQGQAPPVPSCQQAGGTCQANACTSYDNCSSLTGTCQTGYCCQGACTIPPPPPPPSLPNISLTKSADKTQVASGQAITYTITYQNTGQGEARNLSLTDTIPQGTSYVPGSASGNPAFSNNILTWAINSLLPSSQGQVSFQVQVDGQTPIPPPQETNLALNKPVTSSGGEFTPGSQTRVNDGITNTAGQYWAAQATPRWVTIDLQNTYAVNRIKVNPFGRATALYYYDNAWNVKYATAASPNTFLNFTGVSKTQGRGTLQSSSGISITNGDPGTGQADNNYQYYEFTLTPTNARYIRFEVTTGDRDGDSNLDEIEVY